jgi:hypothetical protein
MIDYTKNFPSQVVSDIEKDSFDYGLKVAKAIEDEWFHGSHMNRYKGLYNRFHELRLYARGEQSIQKYKDELSINGDLSYLNLDWTPVPIISKFVDIVVNGMAQRSFDIKAYSQDEYGMYQRTEYMKSIVRDINAKEFKDNAKLLFNMDLYENKVSELPETQEELDLHMQLNYKQSIELAEEQAINVLLEGSKYDLIRNRVLRDIVVLGIGAVKTNFDFSQGATVEYVDPANLVYSKTGGEKAIEKPDTFNPPSDKQGDFTRAIRQVECLYEGAKVIGINKLLDWKKSQNMMREDSDLNKVRMNYSIVAPRMYNDKIESLVKRITGFADMIQLTHLKLQQVLSKMVPDGVYLDADGLAEIDLGNGTNYNPQEALNMFFQTGSVIGRSFTGDGDQNPGKIPIQQIANGAGGQKLASLIQTYNYYLQMIRDVTGLNEAVDASTPDKHALVGIQKIAAANSNTATRHILNGMLFLTADVCEKLSLRISDILEYSPTKDVFMQAIGSRNVATLEHLKELYLYDFGIFLTLEPDEEEKQILENNIQMAIQQKLIELDDAIDIREVRNLKVANQLLKLKKKKKLERDQQLQEKNIKAQSDANINAQRQSAQAEVQKQQQLTQSEIQLETVKNNLRGEYLRQEAAAKKDLMNHEFELNMKLRKIESQAKVDDENMKEDRKDERTRIQASQQSELIEQRKSGKPPKKFESKGNDAIGQGVGIDVGGLEK